MKKITLFILLFFSVAAFAFSAPGSKNKIVIKKETKKQTGKKSSKADSNGSENPMRRNFEIGLADLSLGVINDYLLLDDIFKDTMIIDLDKIKDELNIGYNLSLSPIFFNINVKDKWGFGLSTKLDAAGNFVLPGKMMSLKNAFEEKAEVNTAVFAEMGINWFYKIDQLKIKLKPSMYYPVVYINSDDISYTNNKDSLSVSYDAKLFTAWDENYKITASPGFDLYTGVEFPLAKVLGLSKIPLLDFGVGIDLYGINLSKSSIKNYSEYSGIIGSDNIDIFGVEDGKGGLGEDFFKTNEPVYGMEKRLITRPFRLQAWLDWRPLFGNRLITIYPMAGFSINPIYNEPFSKEYGIKGRLNLKNVFITELTIKQEDRLWQNSLDLTLNLRFVEVDLGFSLKSNTFINSLSGGGLGANFGLKFGW